MELTSAVDAGDVPGEPADGPGNSERTTAAVRTILERGTVPICIGGVPTQFYARLNNLTDELAFSHTSFIKNAAPLTGRNITAGIRVMF